MTASTALHARSERTSPVRIALLDDYELIVAGVQRMLEPFAERVKVVETLAGSATVDQPVDIALYDTFGRADLGVDCIAELVANPDVGNVVVYTSSMPPDRIDELVELGVSGCLSKALSSTDLVRCLENIHDGRLVIAMRATGGPADFMGMGLGLTYREAEVVALLSQGLRNRAIAGALFIGDETVKSHLKSVYRKMGVATRGEAISVALRGSNFNTVD